MTGNRGVAGASEETRFELLRAGMDLVRSRGLAYGIDLRLTEVVERAGRTTGSAYQIWNSQADFQAELAVFIAENVDYAAPEQLEAEVRAGIEAGLEIRELVARVGESYFRRLVDGPEFFVGLHYWTSLDALPKEIESAKVRSYVEVQGQFELFFEAVFSHYQWTVKSDHLELDTLTTLITGMTEGLALRYRFAGDDQAREAIVDLYLGYLDWLLDDIEQS